MRVQAILIRSDGTEGLYAFFGCVTDAREWIAYYLDSPVFTGYGSVLISSPT
jgi:hypothetical protein